MSSLFKHCLVCQSGMSPPSLFLTVLSSSFYFFLSVFSSSFSLSPLLISVLHFFFSFSSLCFCLSLFGQCLNVLSYSLCHLYLSIFLLSRLSLSSLSNISFSLYLSVTSLLLSFPLSHAFLSSLRLFITLFSSSPLYPP